MQILFILCASRPLTTTFRPFALNEFSHIFSLAQRPPTQIYAQRPFEPNSIFHCVCGQMLLSNLFPPQCPIEFILFRFFITFTHLTDFLFRPYLSYSICDMYWLVVVIFPGENNIESKQRPYFMKPIENLCQVYGQNAWRCKCPNTHSWTAIGWRMEGKRIEEFSHNNSSHNDFSWQGRKSHQYNKCS